MFISVPVLYYPDGFDPERDEDLGIKTEVELKQGTMDINTAHICAFNEMDNGNTLLRLTNGDVVESLILYPSFKDLIDKVEHTMEIILDNNN
jgi:competence transcription factor ComK